MNKEVLDDSISDYIDEEITQLIDRANDKFKTHIAAELFAAFANCSAEIGKASEVSIEDFLYFMAKVFKESTYQPPKKLLNPKLN